MQNTSAYWKQVNASRMCPQTSMTIDITRQDGRHPVITRDDIISFTQEINGSSLSGVVTSNRITFKVKNRDNVLDYDSVNNNDVYANAAVNVVYGFKEASGGNYDEIPGGLFYVSAVEIPSRNDQLSFTAKDIIGFMTGTYNASYWFKGSAFGLFKDIIEQAENDPNVPVTSIEYDVDEPYLKSMYISVDSHDNYTLAEMLQLIASACASVLYVNRQGQIVIRRIEDTPEQYTITNTVQYEPCKLTYTDRVGNIKVIYDHGNSSIQTDNSGQGIGGLQTITNPLLYDYSAAQVICSEALKILTIGRRMISGKCRIDPRLDIFDTIIVEGESDIFAGVVVSLNLSYTGSWTGNFKIQSTANPIRKNMRIYELEELTIEQLETYMIYQLCGNDYGDLNTISDDELNYLITSDYALILYESEE